MSQILGIAADEWRYWLRSRLARTLLVIVVLVLASTIALTGWQAREAREARLAHQQVAEETFLAQPDRHPHRMVHYGHYVFRAPAPLAVFDPGVDAVTGRAMFLEGHRQNTAMFAESGASADMAGAGMLTPAFVYQVIVPLLLILVGHSVLTRERDGGTLTLLQAQGVAPERIVAGKAVALFALSAALLTPMLLGLVATMVKDPTATLSLLLVYLLYLVVWAALILLASLWLRERAAVLAVLCVLWVCQAVALPAAGATLANARIAAPGTVETELDMLQAIKDLGDGHNANDVAYAQLRAELLAQYDVETVEELPVNLRGVVAQQAEADLTALMNEFADARMQREQQQADVLSAFGWLSPVIAANTASRAIAGTDLATHHRFLREAERVRYDFVQGLNSLHANDLSYADDIRRNVDAASSRRARIGSHHWQLLDEFRFTPDEAVARLNRAAPAVLMLLLWLVALVGLSMALARRLAR